jgi:hypothetical protein
MRKVNTPRCLKCNRTSTVEVTNEEYVALTRDLNIQQALPERDANFRELVKTGTHPACWEKIFVGSEES